MSRIRPWIIKKEEILDKRGPFTLISSQKENPRNGFVVDFLRIDSVDWVATIPITQDGEVVLVRQYRHAVDSISTEIPAGCAHREESNFAISARRELVEETGYDSDEIEALGFVHPNPGMMPVKAHIFMAKNVKKQTEQKLDDGEDIEVLLKPLGLISEMILKGEITHAMVVSAFALLKARHPELY